MNKRRKVLITITYNEMGIIIDTKAEEVAQPNLQLTCNQLATDCISRQAAIDALDCINGVEEVLKALPSAQPEQRWIPCSERLPECEQEVLICTKVKVVGKNAYIDSIVTPALYEDGTMLEDNSKWIWEDVDYAGWDEEEDCGIIPEGWWENRHFNPDEVCNSPVDREVIAWMPLPEPARLDGEEDG